MSVLSLLVQICAIDWFFVEGDALRSRGALIHSLDGATKLAELEQTGVPHLYFEIRCEEQ